MASFRIRTKIEGDTLVLPELMSLVGKTVDIEVTERPEEASPADRWTAAAEAAQAITDYDFAAWAEQRTLDAAHGGDHLP